MSHWTICRRRGQYKARHARDKHSQCSSYSHWGMAVNNEYDNETDEMVRFPPLLTVKLREDFQERCRRSRMSTTRASMRAFTFKFQRRLHQLWFTAPGKPVNSRGKIPLPSREAVRAHCFCRHVWETSEATSKLQTPVYDSHEEEDSSVRRNVAIG